jgi:hypothetical protein
MNHELEAISALWLEVKEVEVPGNLGTERIVTRLRSIGSSSSGGDETNRERVRSSTKVETDTVAVGARRITVGSD